MLASLLFAGFLWAGCSPDPIARPEQLLIQLEDLPEGSEIGKELPVITEDNLEELHKKKKVTDLVRQELQKLDFETVVTRSYKLPDGSEIASQVLVFKSEKAAIEYFMAHPPRFTGKNEKVFGDQSFTEAVLPPQTSDPEAARLNSIRTRMRLGRIISDLGQSGSDVKKDDHLVFASKAEARLKVVGS